MSQNTDLIKRPPRLSSVFSYIKKHLDPGRPEFHDDLAYRAASDEVLYQKL